MTRPRWAARPGHGAIINREQTERRGTDLLRELISGPDFTGAPCTTTDPEVWYPGKGDNRSANQARTLCRGGMLLGQRVPPCPLRKACLERALDSDDSFTHWGTWGGYTAKKIRRMRNLRAALRRVAEGGRHEDAA